MVTGPDLAFYSNVANALPTLASVFTAVSPAGNAPLAWSVAAGVFTAPYSVTYTLVTDVHTPAGTYALVLPPDLYADGAGIMDAGQSYTIGIGFRPTLSLLGGSSNVIVDNRPVGAQNYWVSKSAVASGGGTVLLSVAAPTDDSLGSYQGVASLAGSVPGWTEGVGGLFHASSLPSFTYVSPSAGTAVLALGTAASGGAGGYTYPVNIAAAPPGSYAISVAAGAVTSATSSIGNYAVSLTLQIGFDVGVSGEEEEEEGFE